jgi:hypothetical protein
LATGWQGFRPLDRLEVQTGRPDAELLDVVTEYVRNSKALSTEGLDSTDYFSNQSTEDNLKALWELVPKAPGPVAFRLLNHLPAIEYFDLLPPKEVLSWLEDNPRFLGTLLLREDVELTDLRRTVFLSKDPRYDQVKYAFAAHHFYLRFDEFHSLLKERPKVLRELHSCDGLSLVMLRALRDCPDVDFTLGGSYDMWNMRLKQAAEKLTSERREKELRWLKIYELAERVVPWDKTTEPNLSSLPDPLGWLGEKAVGGDTWGTFLAFVNAMPPRGLEHWLPDLEDLESRAEIKAHEQMRAAADVEQGTESVVHDFPSSLAEQTGEQATASEAKTGWRAATASPIMGYLLYASAFVLFALAALAEDRFGATQFLILGVACALLGRINRLGKRLDEIKGSHRH